MAVVSAAHFLEDLELDPFDELQSVIEERRPRPFVDVFEGLDEFRTMVHELPHTTLEFFAFSRPAWHADAACKGVDPELFFSSQPVDIRSALALCSSCPVRENCAADAIERGEEQGIWGGVALDSPSSAESDGRAA